MPPRDRSTTHSISSLHSLDDNKSTPEPELRPKESMRSIFSAKMFKPRSASNKESTTGYSDNNLTNELSAFHGPYGFSDSRYGVQVSITGGDAKSKKSTLVEKAARFGREAFGSRSTSNEGSHDTRLPSVPGRYTAVKNVPGLCRDGSSLGTNSSSSSLVSSHSKTWNVRGSVSSSVYDDVETARPISPLHIVKKVSQTPQLPPLEHASDMTCLTGSPLSKMRRSEGEETNDTARASTDSNDSTKTVTQTRMEPSKSHFSWTTYAETERSVSPHGSYHEDPMTLREPDSRFSWTSTSTGSTCQQGSPQASPRDGNSSSIMSRRRPVPPKETGVTKRHDSMGEVHDVTEAGRNKTLPQLPKTRQEGDHIGELTWRLERLEMQRTKMQKVLAELDKVDKASPIDVSEKMRRENVRKMTEVRSRQDELQREMFEVGRLLSRARAKAEEADGSTGLWLRRVTD